MVIISLEQTCTAFKVFMQGCSTNLLQYLVRVEVESRKDSVEYEC